MYICACCWVAERSREQAVSATREYLSHSQKCIWSTSNNGFRNKLVRKTIKWVDEYINLCELAYMHVYNGKSVGWRRVCIIERSVPTDIDGNLIDDWCIRKSSETQVRSRLSFWYCGWLMRDSGGKLGVEAFGIWATVTIKWVANEKYSRCLTRG